MTYLPTWFDIFAVVYEDGQNLAPYKCVTNTSKKEEETIPMFDTKRYLRDRIEDTWFDGKKALARKFNILENDSPTSAKELVDRIKSDEFTLPTTDENGVTTYGTGPYGLIWRDPTMVADRKGYEEAAKTLLETKKDTIDIIFALPEEDGLKALQDFKATVKALNPATLPA